MRDGPSQLQYNEISKEICLYLHIAWCLHCRYKLEAITNCIMSKFYLFAIKSIQHLWVDSKFSAPFSLNGLPVSTQNAPTGASSNKAVQDDGQWGITSNWPEQSPPWRVLGPWTLVTEIRIWLHIKQKKSGWQSHLLGQCLYIFVIDTPLSFYIIPRFERLCQARWCVPIIPLLNKETRVAASVNYHLASFRQNFALLTLI